MESNPRFQLCGILLLLLALSTLVGAPARADSDTASGSEAYRRQAKIEIERANDFHRYQAHNRQIEQKRQSGIPAYKAQVAKEQAQQEKARVAYSDWKKREDAKKPTDEFVERMLAEVAKKEDEKREVQRRKYKVVQEEIQRAIANSRLDENEEYGLEEFNFDQ